jgi:ribosomal protein S12 methylthiotransferase
MDDVLAEATSLTADGAVELNLIAQDLTAYGRDRRDGTSLARLLRALAVRVPQARWLRLLYAYPASVTDELLEVMATEPAVCRYLDMPLQHASDRMLRAMRRGTTSARQRRLVERLRAGIPGLTLRTTFIVGFPGETDADFEALCEFVRDTRFDRVGVFRYSDEEGTAGAELPGKVPRGVARSRYRRLAAIQREIMAEALRAKIGLEGEVLVDSVLGRGRAVGRFASQAPEIDGVTYLKAKGELAPGDLLRARVTGVRGGVDLEAEVAGPGGPG